MQPSPSTTIRPALALMERRRNCSKRCLRGSADVLRWKPRPIAGRSRKSYRTWPIAKRSSVSACAASFSKIRLT